MLAESWGYVAGRYPTARDQAIRRKTSHSVQCIRIGIPRILPMFTDTGSSFRLPPRGYDLTFFLTGLLIDPLGSYYGLLESMLEENGLETLKPRSLCLLHWQS